MPTVEVKRSSGSASEVPVSGHYEHRYDHPQASQSKEEREHLSDSSDNCSVDWNETDSDDSSVDYNVVHVKEDITGPPERAYLETWRQFREHFNLPRKGTDCISFVKRVWPDEDLQSWMVIEVALEICKRTMCNGTMVAVTQYGPS